MRDKIEMNVIAHIHSDFKTKFGIPRQSGIVEALKADIVFEPAYRDINAVRGLEDFSHIWLIWQFSEVVGKPWSPTVRPPRLGGNQRMGVFATRSPFRPNHMGLSCVKLEGITYTSDKGAILHVAGADLMDGTPIYDIKPYLPYVDCQLEAKGGFATPFYDQEIEVIFPKEQLEKVPEEKSQALWRVLAQDPRPSYQNDPERMYGMCFAGLEVKFKVKDRQLIVCEVLQE